MFYSRIYFGTNDLSKWFDIVFFFFLVIQDRSQKKRCAKKSEKFRNIIKKTLILIFPATKCAGIEHLPS